MNAPSGTAALGLAPTILSYLISFQDSASTSPATSRSAWTAA